MNKNYKMKESMKPKTALLKKLLAVMLAALMLLSVVTVPELLQVEAASESEYQEIGSGRTKVGKYYYWVDEKSNVKTVDNKSILDIVEF